MLSLPSAGGGGHFARNLPETLCEGEGSDLYSIVYRGIGMVRGWLCKCWCVLRALCAPACAPNWRLQSRPQLKRAFRKLLAHKGHRWQGAKSVMCCRIPSVNLKLSMFDREPRLGSALSSNTACCPSLQSLLPLNLSGGGVQQLSGGALKRSLDQVGVSPTAEYGHWTRADPSK